MFSKGQKNRRDQFKKGIDSTESRRKREDQGIELRRNKREEMIAKRRQQVNGVAQKIDTPEQAANSGAQAAAQGRDPWIVEKLKILPQIKMGLYSNDIQEVIDTVVQFRRLLSIERNPPIDDVIAVGVVPRLIELLSVSDNAALQFEAAWALTNVASGTTLHTRHVIDNGAVPLFVSLLRSQSADVREQAVWALGNIAGDSHLCRDLVLRSGALEPLLKCIKPDTKVSMLRNITWALSNLCRGKPQPEFEAVADALPVLAQLIFNKDEEVVTDACWALSYLSDDANTQNQKIQAVIESGVARRLVELLMYRSPNVVTPALRTVGNIVTGDDLQTQVILNCGALPCLLSLLNNPKRGIRKEACWAISNITAGSAEQIQAVIDSNIVPQLVTLLRNGEFDIKKEAAWAISNATSGGNEDQIRYLVTQAVISPLCDLLSCPDAKIVLVVLEGIDNILRVGQHDVNDNNVNKFAEWVEECGGLDLLEDLQRHDNERVYKKAARILRTYFEGEAEAVDMTMAPAVANNQFAFNNNQPPKGPDAGGFHF